ncbi:uncharacterized protein LOC119736375 isoform X2 [Patiria miniata]|uniref:Farnesoic acid O-methyl transferase domain-containing protein n=1 Tax=Patiria miniata TaxID=46514 RepID=A0A914ASI8_PATMI|nr:uncharacterized protein LOC119736375 isoform X2 [Patiria miniata]
MIMLQRKASHLVLALLFQIWLEIAIFLLPVRGEMCSAMITAAAGDDLTMLRNKTFAAFRKECRLNKSQLDESKSCSIFTEGGLHDDPYKFNIKPLNMPFRLEFEVKTEYAAGIVLAEDKTDESIFADINIGGMRNQRAVMKPCFHEMCSDLIATHLEAGLVNANEYRPFWIDYKGGVVKVGKGGQQEAFLEWDAGTYHQPVATQVHVGVTSRGYPHADWVLYHACE